MENLREFLIKENQFIYVDTTARRIVDPIKFYESVNTLDGAFSKLSDVIDSAVRTVISSNSSARGRSQQR